MTVLSTACDNFGLTINSKKTEVLYRPAPQKPHVEPIITVKSETLKALEKFTYLGSTLPRAVNIDDKVVAHTAKASTAFGRLRKSAWDRRSIKLATKLKVNKAVVLPSLLYACETSTVYEGHAITLNHFHLNCFRKLLKVTWKDKIPDTEVLSRAELPRIYILQRRAQVRWAGHLVRMPDSRLAKKLFYGELAEGKRSQGCQKKRFKDTLKVSLKSFGINPDTWEIQAQDRLAWRGHFSRGAPSFEQHRIVEAQRKR